MFFIIFYTMTYRSLWYNNFRIKVCFLNNNITFLCSTIKKQLSKLNKERRYKKYQIHNMTHERSKNDIFKNEILKNEEDLNVFIIIGNCYYGHYYYLWLV